jgi:hypothetical protein
MLVEAFRDGGDLLVGDTLEPAHIHSSALHLRELANVRVRRSIVGQQHGLGIFRSGVGLRGGSRTADRSREGPPPWPDPGPLSLDPRLATDSSLLPLTRC